MTAAQELLSVSPPHPSPRCAGDPRGLTPTGARDGPIEIVPYDACWPVSYRAESARLGRLLPGTCLHHIGSTAVPGLAAKPVIDMIALVADLDDAAGLVLRQGGYWLPLRFNVNLSHRRYLCYPTPSYRTHHLHLVDRREDVDACLRFREILRGDPDLAAEYAALKRQLAARFGGDREGYTAAKTAFIQSCVEHPGRIAPTHAPHGRRERLDGAMKICGDGDTPH